MPDFRSDELNPPQLKAATWGAGPVLIIAGAGTGKTRTLVYRVAHLIETGVAPENVLLLTFTRRSAVEMLQRAATLLHFSCNQVMGGTFHAVANIVLRHHGHLLGYPRRFTIIDRADAEDIVKLLKSSLELGGKDKQFPSKRILINAMSKAVNKSMPLQNVIEGQFSHLLGYLDDILKISDHYRQFKFDHGLMDYDDLLANWLKVLQEQDVVRRDLADRYQYIMVDEYQDTNPLQAAIVQLIAGPAGNVMAVGDDSQSIYSFRGADFRNIMEFPQIFPGAAIIKLEENYRSTQGILSVANAVIEQAVEKYTKVLYTNKDQGELPTVHAARDDREQGAFVIAKIKELLRAGEPLSEIAVLFRAGYQAFKLEIELTAAGIVFEKRGGLKLTESAHIKDVLSFLRVVTNESDYLSWNRILLLLEGVGPKTVERAVAAMRGSVVPLDGLLAFARGKAWGEGAAGLVETVLAARAAATPVAAMAMVLDHYDGLFRVVYHDDFPRRQRDLEQLRTIIADYQELQNFLDDTALDPPEAPRAEAVGIAPGQEPLILSTVHSAKGLEWNTVFIIHLVEGKFPMGGEELTSQYEEERRLFYVAVTRARKRLFLLHPRFLTTMDQKIYPAEISSFVAEIPPKLVLKTGTPAAPAFLDPFLAPFNKGMPAPPRQTQAASPQPLSQKGTVAKESFQLGQRVRHNFFGEGVISAVVGRHTVTVDFLRHGRKNLHLDYAKLEILP